jgi:hypothetical protein
MNLKFSFLIKKAHIVMKKAKIVLTAIIAIGIVGGAVAFKAKKFTSTPYFVCGTDLKCDLQKSAAFSALQIGKGGAFQTFVTSNAYLTSQPSVSCSTTSPCNSGSNIYGNENDD